jgi:uncharacterized protein YndB with AHSA1/START domain
MAASTAITISALTVTTPTDWDIVMTCVFDAPRRLIFEAWTKPEHLPHWWGPHGFTLPVCEIDLCPGGTWRFVSRRPNGKEYGFRGVYREIVPYDRLIYTEVFDGLPDNEALVTLDFAEEAGRTTLTSTSRYPSTELRDADLKSGMLDGAAQTLDRLAAYLGGMS